MSTFAYKAIDQRGAQASGKIDGDSKVAVAATLRNQGFTVLDLNEVKQGWGQIRIGGRIKAKDLTVFSRQFATMVNSGLSMLRCLYVLEEQTPNKKFATVVGEVRADVEAGISLSDALGEAPQGLQSPLRQHGPRRRARRHPRRGAQPARHPARERRQHPPRRQVGDGLPDHDRLVRDPRAHRHGAVPHPDLRRHVQGPGRRKLPLLTRIMVGVSGVLRSWWGLVVLVVVIALIIWGLRRLKRTERGTMVWDRFKLRIPMGIGEIVRKLAVARFSRTLGTLITSGVPILQAIEITGQAAGNAVIEKAMVDVQQSVKEGQSITETAREGERVPRQWSRR